MSTPFDWGAVINAFLEAVGTILQNVASFIASNAGIIASVLMGVGLAYFIMTRISRIVPGLSALLGRLF